MKDNILNRVIKKYRSEIDIEGKLRSFFLSELEKSGDNGYAILDDNKLLSTLYPYSPTREKLVQGIDDEKIKNTLNTSYHSSFLTGYSEKSVYITDCIDIDSGVYIKIMIYPIEVNRHSSWEPLEIPTLKEPTEKIGIFIVTDYEDINKKIFKDVSYAMIDSQCKEDNDE